jgi:hypothetical protein
VRRVAVPIFCLLLLASSFSRAEEVKKEAPATKGNDTSSILTEMRRLEHRGGIVFQSPDWKVARKDDALLVLEKAGVPAKKIPFGMLVVAIEQGPERASEIDWLAVEKNMERSARQAGTTLELEPAQDWDKTTAFRGKRFTGTLKAKGVDVAIEMIGLANDGKLVTVSMVAPKNAQSLFSLVEKIASSVKGPKNRNAR